MSFDAIDEFPNLLNGFGLLALISLALVFYALKYESRDLEMHQW